MKDQQMSSYQRSEKLLRAQKGEDEKALRESQSQLVVLRKQHADAQSKAEQAESQNKQLQKQYDDLEDISTDEEDVMIKTVMSWSSSTQSQLLVIDGVKLAGLNHKHILRYTPTYAPTRGSFPTKINGNKWKSMKINANQ